MVLRRPSAAQNFLMHHCHVTDNFVHHLQVCLQCQRGHLEHILERKKSDYLTYKLEALWNDHAQTEVNVHQL